jgi:hypothetical protein
MDSGYSAFPDGCQKTDSIDQAGEAMIHACQPDRQADAISRDIIPERLWVKSHANL